MLLWCMLKWLELDYVLDRAGSMSGYVAQLRVLEICRGVSVLNAPTMALGVASGWF